MHGIGLNTRHWVLRGLYLLAGVLPAGLAAQSPEPGAMAGHIDVALVGAVGTDLLPEQAQAFLSGLRRDGLLAAASMDSDNPLAPCALLAGAIASARINNLWIELLGRGPVMFPPPGSNILGLYDAEIAHAKGRFPRDDPYKTADILARLYILRSWAIGPGLNTLLYPMKQQECLAAFISKDRQLNDRMASIKPSELRFADIPPVSAYFATRDRDTGQALLARIRAPGALEEAVTAGPVPLAACSLLKGFRVASAVNRVWGEFPAAPAAAASGSWFTDYAADIKGGKLPTAIDARNAEVVAAIFAKTVIDSNEMTRKLTEGVTQGDCLIEIFSPGTLRLRLLQRPGSAAGK